MENNEKNEIIEEMTMKLKKGFSNMQFHTGRAWFDFDAAIDRCMEITDKVAEEMKGEINGKERDRIHSTKE